MGSTTRTQRMATGGSPGVYHKQQSLNSRTRRILPPYHETSRSFPRREASATRSCKAVNRCPFNGLGPRRRGAWRSGNAYNCASSRKRLINVTDRAAHNRAKDTQAYAPSPTSVHGRWPNQRPITFTACTVHSTVVLWRRFAAVFARFDGASSVRNGSAHGRVLHGSGTSTIRLIHLRPEHLTTVPFVERTASRYRPQGCSMLKTLVG